MNSKKLTEGLRDWLRALSIQQRIGFGVGAVLIVFAILFFSLSGKIARIFPFFVPTAHYAPVYELVSDKISEHSGIVVNLPDGVALANTTTTSLVTFTPELKGEWVPSEIPKALVYKPSEPLVVGNHYEVSLTTLSGVIRKDFVVDEDPKIIDVFPNDKAEAELRSAITIVFNRPMVPLTTLDTIDTADVPVSITPATKGKFKWISTRALQFIPETSLAGSARYTVTTGSKFISLDGLLVPPSVFHFTTRELRTTYISNGQQTYSKPISFYFNQPIDLARTQREIKLYKGQERAEIPFVAGYGSKTVYPDGGSAQKVEDKTVIEVFPQNANRGHRNVWDFETFYSASIATVYPVGGDINLAGPIVGQITTTPAIQSVTVASEATSLATAELWDPNGTTTITFYEDIDLSRSSISAKGLDKITYGEKCVDTTAATKGFYGYYYYRGPCEKMTDRAQLVFTFNKSQQFAPGEKVPVVFGRLINSGGFPVVNQPLTTTLTMYPALKITGTYPADGAASGSISEFVLCTNVPLKQKNAAEFARDVKANRYMIFQRWNSPYLQGSLYDMNPPCAGTDYVNRFYYGLLPLQKYSLSLALQDVFGQSASRSVNFTAQPAPRFYLEFKSLQKIHNVTSPEHTTLTYAAQNFPSVQMTICKLGAADMVRELSREPRSITDVAPDTSACLSVSQDEIAVPQQQWIYQYFQVTLAKYFKDPRGQYRLSFTNPGYTDYNGRQLYAQTYVSVTNLAFVEKRVQWYSDHYNDKNPQNTISAPTDARGALYFVSDSRTLQPAIGAAVKVYSRDGSEAPFTFEKSGVTDATGVAEFPLMKNVVGAVVTSADGADSTIVTSWADRLDSGAWAWARDNEQTYVYTDRPIYRPGQEVFFKGIYRVNFDGVYKEMPKGEVTAQITNSKGEEILSQNLTLNSYGAFASSVKLPANAPLGTYYISTNSGGVSFSVEAYKAAAFAAGAESNKDEYVAGETVTLDVSAKYYFGVPLDSGDLSWSLTAQDYYFNRYSDEHFSFGGGWYDCRGCGYGDTFLKSGTATLDENGVTQVKQDLDFSALFKSTEKPQSKIFVFHGTIKDKQGRSVSFQKSFIVHRGEFYLGVKADPSFVAAKTPFTLRGKTVDINGKAVSEGGLSYTINKVSWQSFKRQEVDGGFYTQYERVSTPVASDSFRTDGDGNFAREVTLSEPGEYEIVAKGSDGKGNVITGTDSLYVYGAGQADVRPTNNATLDLKAAKTDVKIGEQAKFIIQNPFPHARALVTIERGRIFKYDILDINQNVYQYSFPVTDEYAPNVYASVVLLSEGSAMKFGNLQFTVDRESKKLSIDIAPNKTSYLPGEQVTLTVRTTDSLGRAVPANVSLAVADLSVLALAGNPKKNPLVFFYDNFPLTVSTEVNTKNTLRETPIPTGTKGGSGGGAELANKTRGEFKDTAFWRSDVVTDANGTATVSFTLPDNLTKWQVESVGITKNTLVGASYKEIVAQKNIMAVPIVPRFVIPGDEFQVGVKIFNQTEEKQSLSITLQSSTLKLLDRAAASKTIAPGKTDTVYFSVVATPTMAIGEHKLTFSAQNENYNDTVEQVIPITRNTTYEATATAGSGTDSSAKEFLYLPSNVVPDQGGLTIKTSATLALYLTDALQYLFDYPYGCSEQIASKLRAIAIGKQVLALPNVGKQFVLPLVTFDKRKYSVDDAVAIGLKKLLATQNADGGFAYYQGMQSYPPLTIAVLHSLTDLRDAGYSVSQNALSSAANYAYGQYLSHDEAYYRSRPSEFDGLILALSVLQKVDASSYQYSRALRIVSNLATRSYLSDQASSLALGTLALLAADPNSGISSGLKDRAFAALQNRVTIDSRGAYVKESEVSYLWDYYETRSKDTALLLQALTLDKREYAETDNLIRTLMSSRNKDGSWDSTNTSATVLEAVSKYLAWKKETSSQFTLDTLLDAQSVNKGTFGPDNILKPVESFVPVTSIEKDKLHPITFSKTDLNKEANKFYYDLSLKYFLPADLIPPRDEGFSVKRGLYSLTDEKNTSALKNVKVGEVVRGVVTIVTPKARRFFSLEDFIPAGFELVNFNLATEDKSVLESQSAGVPQQPAGVPTETPSFDDTVPLAASDLYPDFQELLDDRVFLFRQSLPAGTYKYEYYLRATTPGTFRHLPAVASEMYYPENFGRTAGGLFEVTK